MNRNDEQGELFLGIVMALAAGALLGTLSVVPFQALGLSGSMGAVLQSAIAVALLGTLEVGQVTDLTFDPGARSGVFLYQWRGDTVEHKPSPKRLVCGSNGA